MAAMGRFFKRLGGGVLMLAFTVWGAIRVGLFLIGASTAPEDAGVLVNNKWPAFARWFVETPEWSGPLALFAGLGIAAWLVWPPKQQPSAPVVAKSGASPPIAPPPPQLENAVAAQSPEPCNSALLSGPINSIGGIRPTPPPRIDPTSEHENKIAAKEALVPLARDYFDAAFTMLKNFKCEARDRILQKFPHDSEARAVFSRAIDLAPLIPSTRKDYVGRHDLANIDKIRSLNLFEAETSFYHAYIDYGKDARLAVDLVNQCDRLHESQAQKLRELYSAWRAAHERFIERQIALREQYVDLNMVGTLHKNVLQQVPEPDWALLVSRTS